MTVKELKMLLEKVEDDVVVMVKDDGGQYDIANDAYEDTYAFWESWASYKKDVAEWAGVCVEEVDEKLIRKYVWESLREDGFENIEYMYGFEY